MKPTKIVLLVAGLLGLIAIFALPYVSAEGVSIKYWQFREVPASMTEGLLNGPKQVYVALLGFGILAVIGGQALATGKLARWGGIVGVVGALFAFACEGVRKGMSEFEGMSTAIGGKLLFLAAAVGLVASIVAIAKPEK